LQPLQPIPYNFGYVPCLRFTNCPKNEEPRLLNRIKSRLAHIIQVLFDVRFMTIDMPP